MAAHVTHRASNDHSDLAACFHARQPPSYLPSAYASGVVPSMGRSLPPAPSATSLRPAHELPSAAKARREERMLSLNGAGFAPYVPPPDRTAPPAAPGVLDRVSFGQVLNTALFLLGAVVVLAYLYYR